MSTATPSTAAPAEAHHEGHAPVAKTRADLAKLALGALGIVYGDIGTSPLYALKECFTEPHGMARTPANVLGILSLVFWSLMLVIVGKYLTFIMRADNHGEGGILALLALISPARALGERTTGRKLVLVLLGLFGAALLYGDGVITPAISVLGAVEGLGKSFEHFVVPITVVILAVLFLVQKYGTAGVGAFFGPATLLWFVTIAAIGAPWIVRHPSVLFAVDPRHAVSFFINNGKHGFLILGSVVLCITGGEALYADMGHFGKRPIRLAWYGVVLPALLVNYFAQGALLLEHPDVKHPFFDLVSGWVRYPVVAIGTVAAIVASQALISGAFSLTRQAVQLGYCPRVNIVHTSGKAEGQIYIPEVNWALMVSCIALVLAFETSTNLAAAYGIAVTGTMAITSILFFDVTRERWGWKLHSALLLVGAFLVLDLSFFSANVTKILEGGWFPIAVAAIVFTLMTTWKRGRTALGRVMKEATLPLDAFLADVDAMKPHRVPGTAVFMTSNPDGAPPVLLHHFKHNKVLHEKVVLLAISTAQEPDVTPTDRVTVRDLGRGFFQVSARYGFMQTPNVLEVLDRCRASGLEVNEASTSYYLGRETLLTTGRSGMSRWRKSIFSLMSRNARSATAFFGLPPNRVVELGTQIEL